MEVLSAQQMRDVDHYAIHTLGIPSLALMEQAGACAAAALQRRFTPAGRTVYLFCGKGNNGGDGLVMARLLHSQGYHVEVILTAERERLSPDASAMYEKLVDCGVEPKLWEQWDKDTLNIEETDIIVDALLGTGLSSNLRQPYADLVSLINSTPAFTLAVDLPTGLDATTGAVLCQCVKADLTVTFCREKYAHRLPASLEYCGKVELCDIGIPQEAVDSVHPNAHLITKQTLNQLLPPRKANAHKGMFGRILLIGGSLTMSGAISMAAKACLRTGGGLVTTAVPQVIHSVVAQRSMESMCIPLPCQEGAISKEAIPTLLEFAKKCDAVAIGCGMTVTEDTKQVVAALLAHVTCPLILDADAINCVASHMELLQKAAGPVILTPHSGEMGRLLGLTPQEVEADRMGAVRKLADTYHVTALLKGQFTLVAEPEGKLFINTTGNNGMATGGSGDVLTGVIAALAGFRSFAHHPSQAAIAGVYLHGAAGDVAARTHSQYGMIAGDIIEALPQVTKPFDRW
jgi:hydroxyethylthiazole kinase-like uncharacterized protein yjeF